MGYWSAINGAKFRKELLQQLLKQATMTHMNEDIRFRLQRDVWVEFEKGR